MWIVRLALDRPYTFVVLALLILISTPLAVLRTPTDIFPNIDIPVIAVGWSYTGLNPEEMEGRITSVYERVLTTLVDNIEHIESTTYPGRAIVRVFLQPGASLDTANAQVTAASQTILRGLPPGTQPPLVMNYSASSVPILQLGLSSDSISESQLNDLGINFVRPQLVTVPGAVVPYPYGGKMRQVTVSLSPALLQKKNLSPADVLDALSRQNLVLPTGTAKIGEFEYNVRVNASPDTIGEPRGSFLTIRGQLETMRTSYYNLLGGLAFSILLVYLLIVVNFQSWLDPFIIIMGLPAALGGIVLCLFFTYTTLSVPALMGAIMCMGVSTANSILVVAFARERMMEHGDAITAAIEAGFTRFRPVLMTALAMIIGMIPMALGLGEGGEQNAPLGRAVIGGLMMATVASLVFVPTLFALLHHRKSSPPQSDPGLAYRPL
jgi:multidrug efflux pump subunit AcrB